MLPVRLPPELHERLRAWSTEQGFSMASVVRGLVERFLDQQEGATLPKRRPAKRRPKGATARG
jgi:predicted DNA-binding protein